MNKTNVKNRIFTKACDDFFKMDNANDIKRNGITLSEYNVIYDVLKDMFNGAKTVEIIQTNVANWFIKKNFTVKEKCIGWTIFMTA